MIKSEMKYIKRMNTVEIYNLYDCVVVCPNLYYKRQIYLLENKSKI